MGRRFPQPYRPRYLRIADYDSVGMPIGGAMQSSESHDFGTGKPSEILQASPRPSDWFWRPWHAKTLWGLAGLYWIALYAMVLTPAGWLNSWVAGAMILLVLLFNPITVVAILGRGFLKAKVACGEWETVPGLPDAHVEWMRREREAAYINPADARSGFMHQDHLDGRWTSGRDEP